MIQLLVLNRYSIHKYHSQQSTVTLVFYLAHVNQFKAAEKDPKRNKSVQSGHKLEQKTLFMYHMPKIQGRNKYELRERIDFEWDKLEWNSNKVEHPLVDGMEVFNDSILLAVSPNGICVIELYSLAIAGRMTNGIIGFARINSTCTTNI